MLGIFVQMSIFLTLSLPDSLSLCHLFSLLTLGTGLFLRAHGFLALMPVSVCHLGKQRIPLLLMEPLSLENGGIVRNCGSSLEWVSVCSYTGPSHTRRENSEQSANSGS